MIRRIKIVALALLCTLGRAEAAPTNIRAYVLYGQGGHFMASGMESLAADLEKMDSRLQVSVRDWKDHKEVVKEIADRKSTRLNSSHIQKSRMPSSA